MSKANRKAQKKREAKRAKRKARTAKAQGELQPDWLHLDARANPATRRSCRGGCWSRRSTGGQA